MIQELSSADITDWIAFYKVRPFGYVRFARMFGEIVAQQYNMHKTKGRDRPWSDWFPVEVFSKDKDGRDDPERIIALFKQYNTDRGYGETGRKAK